MFARFGMDRRLKQQEKTENNFDGAANLDMHAEMMGLDAMSSTDPTSPVKNDAAC